MYLSHCAYSTRSARAILMKVVNQPKKEGGKADTRTAAVWGWWIKSKIKIKFPEATCSLGNCVIFNSCFIWQNNSLIAESKSSSELFVLSLSLLRFELNFMQIRPLKFDLVYLAWCWLCASALLIHLNVMMAASSIAMKCNYFLTVKKCTIMSDEIGLTFYFTCMLLKFHGFFNSSTYLAVRWNQSAAENGSIIPSEP